MANLKQQIFQELNALEDAAAGLRGTAVAAGKQTDLEVAILTEQVRTLRDKNARAVQLIDKSVSILKKLKWVSFQYPLWTKIIPWGAKMAKNRAWLNWEKWLICVRAKF